MLITETQELEHHFPTSKWDKCEKLLPLFKETERNDLRRQIGVKLLDQLNEDYKRISVPGTGLPFDQCGTSSTYDLLEACGKYIVLLTLANNVRSFATTLNRGGGWNMSTSDNFETPDEEQFKALERELYMRSQNALESICLALEDDAMNDKTYTSLWEGSRTYYVHSDLLLSSASMLQLYYDIEERREKFNSLVPHIKAAQSRLLVPRLGKKLMRALLDMDKVNKKEPYTDEEKKEESEKLQILCEVADECRTALSYFMQSDMELEGKQTKETLHRSELLRQKGDIHATIAIRNIIDNAEKFKEYIIGGPLDLDYAKMVGKGKSFSEVEKERELKLKAEFEGKQYAAPCEKKRPQTGVLNIHAKRR